MGRPRKEQQRRRQSSDSSGPETSTRLGHQSMPANDRERDRMRVQSAAFRRLKNSLPWVPPDTKLSKLDTLRMACCYITHLADVLADEAREGDAEPADVTIMADQPDQMGDGRRLVNLTWPYGFVPEMLGDRTTRQLDNISEQSLMTSVKGHALCGGNVALTSKYSG
ncbi:Transcription factor 21 [Lamellibrachia satsuma]|nr:Transcription factor 21 [Lamellibrachia satsuma]